MNWDEMTKLKISDRYYIRQTEDVSTKNYVIDKLNDVVDIVKNQKKDSKENLRLFIQMMKRKILYLNVFRIIIFLK